MTAKRQRTRGTHRVRPVAARAGKLMPRSGLVDDLVEAIAADRGRPIRMMSEDLGPEDPFGLWIPRSQADWIIVPNGIGAAQRTAIVCHELSHILLGHSPMPYGVADVDALVGQIAPDVDPSVARRFLARSWYDDDLEAEAESLGTILAAKLAQRREHRRVTHDAVSDRLR